MVPQVHLAFQDILLGARRSEDPWTSDGDNNEAGKGNGGAQQAAQVLEIVVASHVSRPFPSFDSCLSLSLSLSLARSNPFADLLSLCVLRAGDTCPRSPTQADETGQLASRGSRGAGKTIGALATQGSVGRGLLLAHRTHRCKTARESRPWSDQ